MRKLIILTVFLAASFGLTTVSAPAHADDDAKTVELTATSGKIEFVGAKVTGDHDGGFKKWTGSAAIGKDGTLKKLVFEVDTTSVWTDTEKLTGHLMSEDFFHTQKYPRATFQSSKIVPSKAKGATHQVTGVMNLHGVIKKISFPATISKDGKSIHAKSEFVINRFDWNIEYKGMADDLIKKDVLLKIEFKIPVS